MSGRAWSGLRGLPVLGELTLKANSWGLRWGKKAQWETSQLPRPISLSSSTRVGAHRETGQPLHTTSFPHHSGNKQRSRADIHQRLRQRGLAFTTHKGSLCLALLYHFLHTYLKKKNPSTSHSFPSTTTSSIKKGGKQQSLFTQYWGSASWHFHQLRNSNLNRGLGRSSTSSRVKKHKSWGFLWNRTNYSCCARSLLTRP